MSKMSNLMIDIQDDIEAGELSFQQIADKYQVPTDWVQVAFDQLCDQQYAYDADPGDMDGDAETALASAGWGTDEDYGYAGDDF